MPLPSDPLKASSEISTPWFAPMAISRRRTLLVIVAANRDDRDVSADFGDDLQRLFDRIVVRFIDRIDQVVAFDIVSRRC